MNLVLSGPSGSGKGTITELLLHDRRFKKFITCTTRNPREGEKNGIDYYFLSEEQFQDYVNKGEIFNIKEYGGYHYGSFEENIDDIKTDSIMIFQLTPDRGLEMKRNNPNTCLILLLPPSAKELNTRRKNRSSKRIDDDILNLEIAKKYDFVIINDNLKTAVLEVLNCINQFNNKQGAYNGITNKEELIDKFIMDLKTTNLSSKVERVFSGKVAEEWDNKSRFVTYHGIKNPIVNEVMLSINDGMRIADIGCGTGKLISKMDKNVNNCEFTGVDISDNMITGAQQRILTGNNKAIFINRDFMQYDFDKQFDIIIFSYVLHHMSNPVDALKKARELLATDGKILFSVPGKDYLKETFFPEELTGRFNMAEMDDIVSKAGLYSLSSCRNRFLMTFNTYEMYIQYLKSIGTYQKIIGYSNDTWNVELNEKIMSRFNNNDYITGEYLTYNCVDKSKVLTRR